MNAGTSLIRSVDGGNSFGERYSTFNDDYDFKGTYVATGPDGEVFLAWGQTNVGKNEVVAIIMGRSTDEGHTFYFSPEIPAIQIGQYINGHYAIKDKKIPADSYPRIAVDNSPFSTGTAYITWAAQPQGGNHADIRMIKGYYVDGQFTWNTSVITVDGSSGEQWMPAINVNPEGSSQYCTIQVVLNLQIRLIQNLNTVLMEEEIFQQQMSETALLLTMDIHLLETTMV